MTIKDCIDIVDNIKPNQYTIKDKVMWLSFIEEIIINEVLKTHEGYDGRYDLFEGYTEDKISTKLIVPSPYDRLYTEYLKMMIDKENGEVTRYNNSAASYNTYMMEYRKHYNKTHMPINTIGKRHMMPPKKTSVGLSDAEYENLKKDMTFILTEYFSNSVSADRISAIVTDFVQNNMEMLKGKNGDTPIKGVDYFNETDKAEINKYIDSKIEAALLILKNVVEKSLVKTVSISLYASKWLENDGKYSQSVSIANVTPYSKIDLQPSVEQLAIFYEKDIAFVVENRDGNITVFCVGQKPTNDYVMQATITEVK